MLICSWRSTPRNYEHGLSRLYSPTPDRTATVNLCGGARGDTTFFSIGVIGTRQARSESRTSVRLVSASLLVRVEWSITTKVLEEDPGKDTFQLPNSGNGQQCKELNVQLPKF